MISPTTSISIVSHSQGSLVANLLADIEHFCACEKVCVVLTLNLPEQLPFTADSFSFSMKIICNTEPQGFAANHNQAFAQITGEYFCVMNPDIRFSSDPFPSLLECLKNPAVGVSAPLVLGETGEIEDSARHFPTPLKLLCKAFDGCKGGDYVVRDENIYPDWVGGMFMLFPREIFKQLGGFDQRYFLYYEDVDLCARLRLLRYEVVLCPKARVVHLAHRSSHRSFRYFRWHLNSLSRFFFSPVYWQLLSRKWL